MRAPRALASAAALVALAIVLCAAAIAAAVLLRQPLADRIWPDTRAQTLRAQAAAALAQGQLTAPDGSGARELYEAALALDPDRNEARAGLHARRPGAALAQARAAMAAERFERGARRVAPGARAVGAARAKPTRSRRNCAAAKPACRPRRVLAQARVARPTGISTASTDAALPLYRAGAGAAAGSTQRWKDARTRSPNCCSRRANALDRGELAIGCRTIVAARELRRRPCRPARRAGAAARARSNSARQRADARPARRQPGPRRAGLSRGVDCAASMPATTAPAQRRKDCSGSAWRNAARAERAAADFRLRRSRSLRCGQARECAPGAAAVRDAERHLATRAANAGAAGEPAPSPARQRQARVAQLLAEAAAAEARGDLLTPPGDSAYDKLRAAQCARAGDSPAVRSASARLLPAATACFERELRGNQPHAARGACLDARRALEGDSNALARGPTTTGAALARGRRRAPGRG